MLDPKQLLADLQNELQGEVIEEVFEIGKHKYTMRLLNDAETSWVYSHLELGSEVGMAMSIRLPQLAAGIRAIDGVTKEELLEEAFQLLSDAQKTLISAGGEGRRLAFYNNKFLNIISKWSTEVNSELHSKWMELENRRSSAQVELKNS
jgi:hypothetical protein